MVGRSVCWTALSAYLVVAVGCGGAEAGQSAPAMAVAGTPGTMTAAGTTTPTAQTSATAGIAAESGGRAAPVGTGAVPTAGTTPPSAAGATASLPAAGAASTTQPSTAGKPASAPTAGAGGTPQPSAAGMQASSAGTSAAAGAPAAADGRIPCDIDKILASRCRSCHGMPVNLGAPMSLVTWADLQKPAVSAPSRKVYELVSARVQDTMRPMPPAQDGKISADHKTLLVDWCTKGAPAAPSGTAECPK